MTVAVAVTVATVLAVAVVVAVLYQFLNGQIFLEYDT